MGILLTRFCRICVKGIQQGKSIDIATDQVCTCILNVGKCGTLLLVILLIIVFGLGIGILVGYCCVKNKKGTLCTHTIACLSSYYSLASH